MLKYAFVFMMALAFEAQAAVIVNSNDYSESAKADVNLDLAQDWWIHGTNEASNVFAAKTGTGITLVAQGGGTVHTQDRAHHTYLWSAGTGSLDNPLAPAAYDPLDYRRRNYDSGLLEGAPALDLAKGVYYTLDVAPGDTAIHQVTVYGLARRNDEIYVEATLRDGSKTVTRASLAPCLLGTQGDASVEASFSFSFSFKADNASDVLTFTIAGYNDSATTVDRSLGLDAVTMEAGHIALPSTIVDTEVVGDSLRLLIDAQSPLTDLMLVRRSHLVTDEWSLTTYATNSTGDYLNADLSAAVPTNGYYAVYVPLVNETDFYSVENTPQSEWYQVAKISDPADTTHELVSGDMTIGITANAGGIINRIKLPGREDLMGPAADPYGRGGQSAIRDQLHGRVYNPTQGGFHDTAGTVCRINRSADDRNLVVATRPCTLFRGDNDYDYIRWEDLVDDKYNTDGDNSDEDPIAEEDLVGKQAAEITSEFDFYGTYENWLGLTGASFGGSSEISIPVVRNYYEYRYLRKPDAIKQFSQGSSKYWPHIGNVSDISVVNPAGTHAHSQYDLGVLIHEISIRIDRAVWTPTHVGLVDGSTINDLTMLVRPTENVNSGLTLRDFNYNYDLSARAPDAPNNKHADIEVPIFILADSDDIDAPGALGLYYPNSDINVFSVVGMDRESGAIVYKDDRRMQNDLRDTAFRTKDMAWCGFRGLLTGLLNCNRLPATQYEAMRGEYYLLYGTPREIFENAQRIHRF